MSRAQEQCKHLANFEMHDWAFQGKAGAIQHFCDVCRLYDIDIRHWDFSAIHYPAIWPQLPKLLALFFTVAFGSSMDVVWSPPRNCILASASIAGAEGMCMIMPQS